jgi:hypothetical protein
LLRVGREIDVTWPVSVDAVVAEMEGFLNPDLRHHHSGSSVISLRMGRAPLGLWSEEVYAALVSLTRNRTEARSLARLADV